MRFLSLLPRRVQTDALQEEAWRQIAHAEKTVQDHAAVLEGYKKEIARLEGLLDIPGSDPDHYIPGVSNQSLYRTLSGNGEGSRDLPDSKRADIQRLSHRSFALRGDAEDIVETTIDFILGDDGIKPVPVKAADTATKTALDEIWSDPPLDVWLKSLLLDGERFSLVHLSQASGAVDLSWIPPEAISTVRKTPAGIPYLIQHRPPGVTEDRIYFCLDCLDERFTITPGGNKKYTITEKTVSALGVEQQISLDVDGLAFAWIWSDIDGGTRGKPELTSVLDYIDVHDETIWTTLEREKLLKLFLLEVTSPDINTPADGQAKLKELGLVGVPEGPKALAHNDRLKIDFMQPTLSTASFADLERIVSLNIYRAKGFPEHWGGSGADANLATAAAQEAKPLRRLKRKQGAFVRMLRRYVAACLELRQRAGSLPVILKEAWTMQVMEIGGKDKTAGASVVSVVISAVSTATSQGLISKEAGNKIVVQVMREAGIEIPEEIAGMPEGYEGDQIELLLRRLSKKNPTEKGQPSSEEPETENE